MVVNPYLNYIPASDSTYTSFTAPASSSSVTFWNSRWGGCDFMLYSLIEDDWIYQERQRKIRYAPFHVKNKPSYSKTVFNKKPILLQIPKQPFRIGKQ